MRPWAPASGPGKVPASDHARQPRYARLSDRYRAKKDIVMTNKKRHTLSGPEAPDNAEAVKHIPSLIPRTPGTIFRALLGVLLFFCGILLGVWLIIRFRRDT
jgi:hypothetical protein